MKTVKDEVFLRNLNRFIKHCGKTKTEIAIELGISMGVLTGKKEPNAAQLDLLASYFKISKVQLFIID